MNRRLLLLSLLLLAIPALSQSTSSTVVVLDQSYSMSLPAGASGTRLSLLLNAVEQRILADRNQDRFALIAFQDAHEIAVVVPYPASSAAVLSAVDDLIPWGTSPVLAATRFALDYAADLPGPTEVILVTDGEDDDAYITGSEVRTAVPRELLGHLVSLTVMTLGGDRPGATDIPALWAAESGGEVILVEQNGQRTALPTSHPSAVLDHETSTAPDEIGVATATPAGDGPPRTGFVRVLAVWLLVVRWNLAASAILGIIAFALAVARWRPRSAAANRHNALPTQVVLEVRTSLRRWTHTFSKFPITVGTTPGCTLQLTNGGKAPDQAFELRLADEGLLF